MPCSGGESEIGSDALSNVCDQRQIVIRLGKGGELLKAAGDFEEFQPHRRVVELGRELRQTRRLFTIESRAATLGHFRTLVPRHNETVRSLLTNGATLCWQGYLDAKSQWRIRGRILRDCAYAGFSLTLR